MSFDAPKGWTATSLGEWAPFSYGKGLPESKRHPGAVGVFSSAGCTGSHDEALIETPGVVIGRKGTVGSIHWADGPFWPIDTSYYVCAADHRDLRFTYWALKSLSPRMTTMNTDSAVPGLNRANAHSLQLAVPPLPEQRRIAGVLDALDTKLNANAQQVARLDELTRFAWMRRFGKAWRAKSELPSGWRTGLLSEIVGTQYGYTASASTDEVGPRFLRVKDINKTNWIDWEHVPFCPIEPSSFEKYRLVVGDILVARMADPGKAAIVESNVEAVFASYLARIVQEAALVSGRVAVGSVESIAG